MGSTKNPPKKEEKREGDTTHRNQRALQIVILSLLSLIVILTWMYLLNQKLAHPVMIGGGRGRDLKETGIDVLKERRSDVRKGAKGVIRNQNADQKGCFSEFYLVSRMLLSCRILDAICSIMGGNSCNIFIIS